MIKLEGLGISPGIAAGHAFITRSMPVAYAKECRDTVNEEIKKLKMAVEVSVTELRKLYNATKTKLGAREAGFFEAQIRMLKDEDFITKIEDEIGSNKINGEWAVANVRDYYASMFESTDNEYHRERAMEIKDIAKRLIQHMQNNEEKKKGTIPKSIIIARELTLSDTVSLNSEEISGLLTEAGESATYSAILANSIGIPAVVAIPQLITSIQWNDYIAFDGKTGEIYINPSEDILRQLMVRRNQSVKRIKRRDVVEEIKNGDGHSIAVLANITSVNDIKAALENDADGIGLFRTEFLYQGRYQGPSEQEQFETYKAAAMKMGDKPLTIRTLDLGGDKWVNYLDIHKEQNPFLGYRAIRFCLDRRELFKEQLRAILRASAFGSIQVLFPMICTLQELREAKSILEAAKRELESEGLPYNRSIQAGIMIETPAAALMSDLFAGEADFFSIGTNDLAQYTLAVDRLNTSVQYLYNFFQPSLLRLIKMIVDNAHKKNIKVGMCGEAARERKLIPVWAGMGMDELSMNAQAILKVREELGKTLYVNAQKWISELLELPTDRDVEKFLDANANRLDVTG